MSAARKLAVPPVAHPRPWQTYYYESVRDGEAAWSRLGRAASIRGAARAALGRIIDRQYVAATICDEDGVVVARLYRKGKSIVWVEV